MHVTVEEHYRCVWNVFHQRITQQLHFAYRLPIGPGAMEQLSPGDGGGGGGGMDVTKPDAAPGLLCSRVIQIDIAFHIALCMCLTVL